MLITTFVVLVAIPMLFAQLVEIKKSEVVRILFTLYHNTHFSEYETKIYDFFMDAVENSPNRCFVSSETKNKMEISANLVKEVRKTQKTQQNFETWENESTFINSISTLDCEIIQYTLHYLLFLGRNYFETHQKVHYLLLRLTRNKQTLTKKEQEILDMEFSMQNQAKKFLFGAINPQQYRAIVFDKFRLSEFETLWEFAVWQLLHEFEINTFGILLSKKY